MREPLEWRNARILDRAVPGTLGGRLEQAQPVVPVPSRGRQVTPGRGHSVMLAASDATDKEKRGADIVCDGVDDQVQVLAASLLLAGNGGKLALSSGTFNFTDSVLVDKFVTIAGMGPAATFILCDACNAFRLRQYSELRDLYLLGDGTHTGVDTISSSVEQWMTIQNINIDSFALGVVLNGGYARVLDNVISFCATVAVKAAQNAGSADGEFALICRNRMIACPGVLIDAQGCGVYENFGFADVGGNGIEVTANGADSNVHDNDMSGYAIDYLISANRCSVHDNRVDSLLRVGGDFCSIQANMMPGATLDILAAADKTIAVMNDIRGGTLTNGGTNTKLNLDGSANNWNRLT